MVYVDALLLILSLLLFCFGRHGIGLFPPVVRTAPTGEIDLRV
jgi:hypothetical protein